MTADLRLVLPSLLAAPLVASVVSTGWSRLWQDRDSGPLSSRVHTLVLVVQCVVVLALLGLPASRVSYALAACCYAGLGAGAAVLLRQRGQVPCGCWGGGNGRLSGRLVLFDLCLAAAATRAAASPPESVPDAAASVSVLGVLCLCSFIALVGLPDLRHALKGVRPRAEQEQRWFARFPDLEEA